MSVRPVFKTNSDTVRHVSRHCHHVPPCVILIFFHKQVFK